LFSLNHGCHLILQHIDDNSQAENSQYETALAHFSGGRWTLE